MFDVDFTELVVIFVVALIVLGPKRLPGLVSKVGRWAGKARSMARQFREQLESEVQLEEIARMNKPAPPSYPAPPPEFGGEPPAPPEPPETGPAMAPADAVAPEASAPEPGSHLPADDPSHNDLSDPPAEEVKEPPLGRSF